MSHQQRNAASWLPKAQSAAHALLASGTAAASQIADNIHNLGLGSEPMTPGLLQQHEELPAEPVSTDETGDPHQLDCVLHYLPTQVRLASMCIPLQGHRQCQASRCFLTMKTVGLSGR